MELSLEFQGVASLTRVIESRAVNLDFEQTILVFERGQVLITVL